MWLLLREFFKPAPPAATADPGGHGGGADRRRAGLSHRARHGPGLQHGDRPRPRRRHPAKVAFTEGQDVKAGDLLAQIDPRPLSGPARPGRRHQGARRSAARQRQARSAALPEAGRARLDRDAAARHAGRAGRPGRRDGPERPGADRLRHGAARLHHDHLADRRPHRRAPDRRRQHRSCDRHHRPGGDDPDRADLGALHPAGGRFRAGQPADGGGHRSRSPPRAGPTTRCWARERCC